MKKRILALVLGLVMMTSGLYGCAGESKDTKEESKGEDLVMELRKQHSLSGAGMRTSTFPQWRQQVNTIRRLAMKM